MDAYFREPVVAANRRGSIVEYTREPPAEP